MSSIIDQLEQARTLAFSNKSTFPQVLRQVLRLANNPDPGVQKWCSAFFKDSFTSSNDVLGLSDKVDLAIDALDSLLFLSEVKELEIFKNCIETTIVVYKLVFKYVVDNDGCGDIWQKLQTLTRSIVSKYRTSFPLEPEDEESDLRRGVDCKLELMKFILVVIDYQTVTSPGSKKVRSNANGNGGNGVGNGAGADPNIGVGLNRVPPNHTLVKPQQLEAEAFAYLDTLLSVFTSEILITPLITATLNHFALIASRKPQLLSRILNVLEHFDTQQKNQSNYETIEEFKLSRKYVDRGIKIFLNYVLRNQLVGSNYQQSLSKKVTNLIQRGDEIRKKNILAPSREDANIRKRKFDGFVNADKRLKTLDYKNLYNLNEADNELNNFDLTTLPSHILIAMTLNALNKVSVDKLTKALGIIVDRYNYAVESAPSVPQDAAAGPSKKRVKREGGGGGGGGVDDDDDDDDDAGEKYDADSVYTLPPPQELSFDEKKSHVNIIIKNFFRLAERHSGDEPVVAVAATATAGGNESGVDAELTKIAIQSWKKESWLVLLTRLATRGMRGVDSSDPETLNSDEAQNLDISNLIRKALFDHFLANIHSRIDIIIEWLSEEWYSEKVFNEEKLIKELEAEHGKDPAKIEEIVNSTTIKTPIYNSWAGKVLDAMIPFLEPNDRKIFIRLLSDLPYLNAELVERIKSLCIDPVRSKIGFLSLQFLIMYRPPVKSACMSILEELSKSDQEDLRDESTKLLKKYE